MRLSFLFFNSLFLLLVHLSLITSQRIFYSWGGNLNGQLGDGTTTQRNSPVTIGGYSLPSGGQGEISAGNTHSLALLANGTILAWGLNTYGQLGDGTTTQRNSPVAITLIGQPFTKISVGLFHSLALSNGDVYSWGYNNNGQLGDGSSTTSSRNAPLVISGFAGISQISAGEYHSLALQNGNVFSWGRNVNGQLGDGTLLQRSSPVNVSAFSTQVTQISAGGSHSLALLGDGTVYSWGWNFYGQLGDGTKTDRSSPVPIPGLLGVTQISAGYFHSLALLGNGVVMAWGRNDNGQLGDGTTTQRSSQVLVPGLTGVTQIAAGGSHSLAVLSNGNLKAWGGNLNGQLGDGTTTQRNSPVNVPGFLGGVSSKISAGNIHSMVLYNTLTTTAEATTAQMITTGQFVIPDTLISWGLNSNGQLGDNTTTSRSSPANVPGFLGVTRLSSGGSHSLALLSNRFVLAWGDNSVGQLGDQTTTQRNSPITIPGLSGVTQISAGYFHSLALLAIGSVMAWGSNSNGQLGDGTTTNRNTPVFVSGLSSVTQISAGNFHSLALMANGSVFAWGYNFNGQLGDGTKIQRLTPILVPGLFGITQISAGSSHSFALLGDGNVYGWGNNLFGQVGDGTTAEKLSPLLIGLSGIKQIVAGNQFSVALTERGSVMAWGDNTNGQLGDGTTTQRNSPSLVPGVTGVTQISVASGIGSHCIALLGSGVVKAWGRNTNGQIGDNTTTNRLISYTVPGLSSIVRISAGSSFSIAFYQPGLVTTDSQTTRESFTTSEQTTAERTTELALEQTTKFQNSNQQTTSVMSGQVTGQRANSANSIFVSFVFISVFCFLLIIL